MEQKPTDACKAKHNHACEQDYSAEGSKEVRTSQVSRRLLRALSFKEGDGQLISMPAKKPKTGGEGVVHFGHGDCKSRNAVSGTMRVLHVEPPKTVAQETELVARIKKISGDKPLTPVLFTASLVRSGGGHGPKTGSLVGGESSSVGKLSEFRGILKLLKRLIKRFPPIAARLFSLDMPSTCSCWSWPELHALLGPKRF